MKLDRFNSMERCPLRAIQDPVRRSHKYYEKFHKKLTVAESKENTEEWRSSRNWRIRRKKT